MTDIINAETPSKLVDVWIITPHESTSYDDCIIPVSSDPDGAKALQHAKDSLERQWDQWSDLGTMEIAVKIERCKWNEEELPDDDR